MSAIYNLEPQPTGSVILHTTQGELAVELFVKQTPLTCRNFLQLCVDGYYDNTIFHRLVPGFIIQGGDPTGTGNGGESIYDGGAFSGELDPWPMDLRQGKNAGPMGICFRDEFHTRLKFNRRGLLGMANESRPDTNGSQFFFTLDKTDELNGKNTMFGRIAGDTIYNLAKMGEAEVEEGTERPVYPMKITHVEVLINPFDDIKKRSRVAPQQAPVAADKKKKKRKGAKQILSFGDDEDGDTDLPVLKKTKFDTRIVAAAADEDDDEKRPAKKANNTKQSQITRGGSPVDDDARIVRSEPQRARPTSTTTQSDSQSKGKSTEAGKPEAEVVDIEEDDNDDSLKKPKKTALERTNEEIAALKASMKRTVNPEPVQEVKKTALEKLIPETSTRGRKKGADGKFAVSEAEDQKTLDLLRSFQSKLSRAAPSKPASTAPTTADNDKRPDSGLAKPEQDEEDEANVCDLHFIANCQSCQSWDKQEKADDSDDEGWMSHKLTFEADRLGKDLTNRRKAEEELVVIDPRARERTLKEEKRAQREARSGQSGRAWDQARDQARNAQMARLASLAGRGAK